MKIFAGVLLISIFAGCKLKPDSSLITTDAIHFAGVFISENIKSDQNFRIKGIPDIKNSIDSIYKISGLVEGYSPMNYPISIDHFTEFLHYLGGNPDDEKNWSCLEIYIGRKKLK